MPAGEPPRSPAADPDAAVKVTQAPAPAKPANGYVKYVGANATVRIIRKNEWPGSIKSDKLPSEDLVWEKGNGYMVPLEKLNDELLKVLEDDGSFLVIKS